MATAKHFRWVKGKVEKPGDRQHLLKCRCGSRLFFVAYEKVKAKRHTPTGNRFRIAATCPYCKRQNALKHGN